MTLMKDAPLPTFGKIISEIAGDALKSVSGKFGLNSYKVEQSVVRRFVPTGDQFVGIRIFGASFEGLLFLSVEKNLLNLLNEPSKDQIVSHSVLGMIFDAALDFFVGRVREHDCVVKSSGEAEILSDGSNHPEEWLVSRLSSEAGSCWLTFGYSGSLPFSSDDLPLANTAAKDMTFF